LDVEIVILAGGLSRRMGRDKARLRLGGRTLVQRIAHAAKACGGRVRVVRKDIVPRCGPLGGVLTGFARARADAVLFLSCDMPFVDASLLRELVAQFQRARRGVFTWSGASAGFPFLLPTAARSTVRALIRAKRLSLQELVRESRARRWRPPRHYRDQLLNVNTPPAWEHARLQWAARRALGPLAAPTDVSLP
jgi:molybdopterin-guanine dinucleotide biosynthesis protein A